MRHGVKPDLKHLQMFGCVVYMQQPAELRTKLDWTSKQCILVGYELSTTQYRLWCPENRRIYVSRDVDIIETEKPALQSNTSQESPMLDELEELEEDGLPPILGEHDNDLEAEVPKEGIIDDDLEAEVPKEGIIDDDLEAGVPKEGIVNNDLEVKTPKAGVMDAPEKETEPPSDLAEQENPKSQRPGSKRLRGE